MRKRAQKQGISVHAISGTHTVTLGFNATEQARQGLLGFALKRYDHTEEEAYWLRGFKTFESVVPRPEPGQNYSLLEHPIQTFLWGDYTAKPAHDYTYEVAPLYGKPKWILEGPRVKVRIRTEREDTGRNAVFFNRGVAGSQAYAWKFGNKSPDEVPDRKAYVWLSRGLEEALLSFIAQADGPSRALRASLYEFNYQPVLAAFKAAHEAGADVKIVYDARDEDVRKATQAAIQAAGLPQNILIPRTRTKSYIAHNKFIVLLKNGRPSQVWTGSTNITRGGIFGQSNVGHLVRDSQVAKAYLGYWKLLAADPENKVLKPQLSALNPDIAGEAPEGISAVFSPRPNLAALEWYARQADLADQTVALTAAFGIHDLMATVLNKDKDYPRFLLLEKLGNNHVIYAADPDVHVSVGSHLGTDALYRWAAEKLTGFNVHVKYVHTKFMLVDPLTGDPLVVSGSANFSTASTRDNDENMLVIRGDERVADVYLGEFMRLFNHYYFRYHANRLLMMEEEEALTREQKSGIFLAETDSWTNRYYNPAHPKYKERLLFG